MGSFKWDIFKIIAVVVGGLASFSWAQTPTPSVDILSLPSVDWERNAVDKNRVGDRIELRLSTEISQRVVEAKLPEGSSSWFDLGFELVPKKEALASSSTGFSITVSPLRPGRLTLPALVLNDRDGKPATRSNPLSFEVVSAIREDDPVPNLPAEVQTPVALNFPWWVIALITVVGGGLVGLIVYGLIRWSRRHKRPRAGASDLPPPPPLPEDEEAMRALRELEAKRYLDQGNFKLHYFGASEVLKIYLGARYRFDALESTSGEIIQALEDRRHLQDEWLDRIESVFRKMDIVKFTDQTPELNEAKRITDEIRGIVTATRKSVTHVQVNQNAT